MSRLGIPRCPECQALSIEPLEWTRDQDYLSVRIKCLNCGNINEFTYPIIPGLGIPSQT